MKLETQRFLERGLIGAGECFEKYYLDSHNAFKEEGIGSITTVVDVKEQSEVKVPKDISYLKRESPNQPLSELLQENSGIVCLAHPNSFHIKDAEDLITHGHRVLIEKPFAVNSKEMSTLDTLYESKNVGLPEYYMFGKTAPLQILSGNIRPDSFFFRDHVLTKDVEKLRENSGRVFDFIGDIKFVHTEVLEGEGSTGTVLHRTHDLSIAQNGGGMIQDLGIHALSPLMPILRKIKKYPHVEKIRTSVCEEHFQYFIGKGYRPEDIAETYARALLMAEDIPINLVVGKYVLGGPEKGRNQRRLCIIGSKGRIDFDMSNCEMAVYTGDKINPEFVVGVERRSLPRYYPVLRQAIYELYEFSPPVLTQSALETQRFVIDLVNLARKDYGSMPTYRWGEEVDSIDRK